ncbi:Transcription factor rbf1 (RPG-box-binding factor) (Repressor-activator protein 1) [Microsporum ferrugineum]
MAITLEFNRIEGHPYSWHSVRRKVEFVTQQRIKFLNGMGGKRGDDQADAAWSAAVDAWVPVWRRFQQQETERISAKQGKRGRKRKSIAVDAANLDAPNHQTPAPQPPATQQPSQQHTPQPQQAEIQLPMGFGTMFNNTPSNNGAEHAHAHPVNAGTPDLLAPTTTNPSSSSPQTDPNNVSAATLKALSRLNNTPKAAISRNPNLSPSTAMLMSAAENSSSRRPFNSPSIPVSVSLTDTHQHHPHPGPGPGARGSNTANPGVPVSGVSGAPTANGNLTDVYMADVSAAASAVAQSISVSTIDQIRAELRAEFREQLQKDRLQLEEKITSVQQTQEMILSLLNDQRFMK